MELRGTLFAVCVLCLLHITYQQKKVPAKKNNQAKKAVTPRVIEEIKKQIESILLDLDSLKEQQALQTVCLRGFKILRKCFLVFSGEKNYHEASEDCMLHGGLLSTPRNGEENDQLYEYAKNTVGPNLDIWLGVTDMVTEGKWLDLNGNNITFTNWETEITLQPDGASRENCVLLSGQANGKWFDESCRSAKHFICEYNIP
ncbi:tetranectin isoform X1 [Callorhinchus milii]|uniref:C-type lectin domain family 3 member B n=1 Tax=Callorhinchus milii TaxID=7868 RepID=V9L3U9_CALMI|nr:tetranectin isoform X1 [Callorhinchus milii]|eukprot:gi/632967256/ref/XP_007899878.1/ PREDICTED: tetranectin isoform X2 [Callorhinchus milii]